MPIYAYRCATCGHAQDVLQRLSDPVLTVCPACGAATYAKQLTAAGFQLKGSGWYVTDFKGGNQGAPKKDGETGKADAAPAADTGKADPAASKSDAAGGSGKADSPAPAPAAAKPAAAAGTPAAPAAPSPPPSAGR